MQKVVTEHAAVSIKLQIAMFNLCKSMGGSELLSLHIAVVQPVFVRCPLESAFVGDHFGVHFMKIDRIIPELCMHKYLH